MENKIFIAETERLILRRYKKEDIQDLFEYLSDEEVVKYEPYKPQTFDETKENLEWRIGTDEMIAVELKNSHKMIGNVYMGKRDFEALEIGYVFNRNYWGYGPMSILWTEKVERLCSFFEFLILLLLGCYVTNRTVYSFSVIPALYVFKNCSADFR